MEQYILSIDAGTTSARCIIFDKQGNVRAMKQRELHMVYPHDGWVEQSAREIWEVQHTVCQEAIAALAIRPEQIAAIGITNQRETTIVWDKQTGEPIAPAIVWQCRRTASMAEDLRTRGLEPYIRKTTGLLVDAYFSATKISWILDHVTGARHRAKRGELLFGTVDSWLIWNLTGGKRHVTDVTNAARTMLFDIHAHKWDAAICRELDIPMELLPEVVPSSGVLGETEAQLFGAPIPIAGVAGDQQAALFGQTCFLPGEAKNTYGTGCFLLMNTGTKPVFSDNGLVTTLAWGIDGKVNYALEGSIFIGGASVQWLRDELRLIDSAEDSEYMARKVKDTNGCYVVPAFTGLGAPYWNQYARGTIVGLTRGVNKYHIIRATLESIAYQVSDVLRAMEADSGITLSALKVDGGASANDFLMQTQADIIQTPVNRPICLETTALGAAYLAGLAVGYWKDFEDIRRNAGVSRAFVPEITQQECRERLDGWKRAVGCAISWTKQ